jgi:hypothetical protein
MPVSKTFVEGNVRTEILDLREGVGEHRSIDEILSKTGGATGTYEEVGEDGTKYTYSVEVEEVSELMIQLLSYVTFVRYDVSNRRYSGIMFVRPTIFRCVQHDVCLM